MLELTQIAELNVLVGTPVEVGKTAAGERRMVPILGGEVSGAQLNGRILAGSADYQLIRSDGVTELHARYVIETADGIRIYVENTGIRHGTPEAMERLRRGEPVDPALIYFRTTVTFEVEVSEKAAAYAFLTRHIFVCAGVRHPDRVQITVYKVA
jgi:hypothetical protein